MLEFFSATPRQNRAVTKTQMGAVVQNGDVAFAQQPEIVPSAPPNPLLKSMASSRSRNFATRPSSSRWRSVMPESIGEPHAPIP